MTSKLPSIIQKYLKLAQSPQAKWMMGVDESFSDKLGYAPASDHNNAAFKDDPYATTAKKPAPDQRLKQMAYDVSDAVSLLLADHKFQQSTGLKAINAKMPEIVEILNSPNFDKAALQGSLQNLSFFTNPANKGVGFDPATLQKTGKYLAPADYIKQMLALLA